MFEIEIETSWTHEDEQGKKVKTVLGVRRLKRLVGHSCGPEGCKPAGYVPMRFHTAEAASNALMRWPLKEGETGRIVPVEEAKGSKPLT